MRRSVLVVTLVLATLFVLLTSVVSGAAVGAEIANDTPVTNTSGELQPEDTLGELSHAETIKLTRPVRDAVEAGSSSIDVVVVGTEDADTSAIESVIDSEGGSVDVTYAGNVVGTVSDSAVVQLAQHDQVVHVREPAPVETNPPEDLPIDEYYDYGDRALNTVTEGVPTTNAHVLHATNVTGAGATVAVLDTRFNPDNAKIAGQVVETRSFDNDGAFANETGLPGTASAEVVADVAPGADLILLSVQNEGDLIRAANWIDEHDIDIATMSFDLPPSVGPRDGSDYVSQRLSTIDDVNWITSAGNRGTHHEVRRETDSGNLVTWPHQKHWQTDEWVDTSRDGLLEFDETGRWWFNYINHGGGTIYVSWDEWDDDSERYRLIVDPESDHCDRTSVYTTLPYEKIDIPATCGPLGEIQIENIDAEGNTEIVDRTDRRITIESAGSITFNETTVADNLLPPATNDGVITVGAIDRSICGPPASQRRTWGCPEVPDYSSQGDEIDFAAPTGVAQAENSVFHGTEAAAPHVAGVAALLTDANRHLTATDRREILNATARDSYDPAEVSYGDVIWDTGVFSSVIEGTSYGPDNQVGHGHVDALAAHDHLGEYTGPSVADYTVDRCQILRADGTYELVDDVSGPTRWDGSGCFPVMTDDVTIDGAGHELSLGTHDSDQVKFGIKGTNLTVSDRFSREGWPDAEGIYPLEVRPGIETLPQDMGPRDGRNDVVTWDLPDGDPPEPTAPSEPLPDRTPQIAEPRVSDWDYTASNSPGHIDVSCAIDVDAQAVTYEFTNYRFDTMNGGTTALSLNVSAGDTLVAGGWNGSEHAEIVQIPKRSSGEAPVEYTHTVGFNTTLIGEAAPDEGATEFVVSTEIGDLVEEKEYDQPCANLGIDSFESLTHATHNLSQTPPKVISNAYFEVLDEPTESVTVRDLTIRTGEGDEAIAVGEYEAGTMGFSIEPWNGRYRLEVREDLSNRVHPDRRGTTTSFRWWEHTNYTTVHPHTYDNVTTVDVDVRNLETGSSVSDAGTVRSSNVNVLDGANYGLNVLGSSEVTITDSNLTGARRSGIFSRSNTDLSISSVQANTNRKADPAIDVSDSDTVLIENGTFEAQFHTALRTQDVLNPVQLDNTILSGRTWSLVTDASTTVDGSNVTFDPTEEADEDLSPVESVDFEVSDVAMSESAPDISPPPGEWREVAGTLSIVDTGFFPLTGSGTISNLTFRYDDLPPDADEGSIEVWLYDHDSGQWTNDSTSVETTVVDADANLVRANAHDTGEFAAFIQDSWEGSATVEVRESFGTPLSDSPDGDPITNATVVLEDEETGETHSFVTGNDGTVPVTVPADEYAVTVEHTAYTSNTTTASIDANPGQTIAVSIDPVKTTLAVEAVSGDGHPIEDASVTIASARTGQTVAAGSTDTDGTMNFDIWAGEYDVAIESEGHDDVSVDGVAIGTNGTRLRFDMDRGTWQHVTGNPLQAIAGQNEPADRVTFQDVLTAIEAFNDGDGIDGQTIDFQTILDAIAAFNTGEAI